MRTLSILLALTLTAPFAAAVPFQLSHQGKLFDSAGTPLTGSHALVVTLYDAPTAGAVVWTDNQTALFDQGFYSIVLGTGSGPALDTTVFDGRALYLTLGVDGGPELPRIPLVSVPYAIRAETASNVQGGVVDATEIRVNGQTVINTEGALIAPLATPVSFNDLQDVPASLTDGDDDALGGLTCASGQITVFDGAAWACADQSSSFPASAITSGLIDINRIPVGTSAGQVAPGDHTHDAADVTTGLFAPERIPSLDAAKINSGTFNADRIPSLDAAKIESGTLNADRIPGLDAAKITGGSLAIARIPVGTVAGTVAAGNHTHTAAEVGALPVGGGTLTGDLAGTNGRFTGVVQVGAGTTCNTAGAGSLRWTGTDLEVCTGSEWRSLAAPLGDGSSATNAARDCAAIKADFPALGNGTYWIDPDNDGNPANAFSAYCDQTTDGGGWTLVARAHDGTTTAHRNNGAVGALTAPNQTTTAKFSDAIINQLRGGAYIDSVIRMRTDDGKIDYFRDSKTFVALGGTASVNRVFDTWSAVQAQSGACNGTYNSSIHTGLVGWSCYDHMLYGDNPGMRSGNLYQGGAVWVKRL